MNNNIKNYNKINTNILELDFYLNTEALFHKHSTYITQHLLKEFYLNKDNSNIDKYKIYDDFILKEFINTFNENDFNTILEEFKNKFIFSENLFKKYISKYDNKENIEILFNTFFNEKDINKLNKKENILDYFIKHKDLFKKEYDFKYKISGRDKFSLDKSNSEIINRTSKIYSILKENFNIDEEVYFTKFKELISSLSIDIINNFEENFPEECKELNEAEKVINVNKRIRDIRIVINDIKNNENIEYTDLVKDIVYLSLKNEDLSKIKKLTGGIETIGTDISNRFITKLQFYIPEFNEKEKINFLKKRIFIKNQKDIISTSNSEVKKDLKEIIQLILKDKYNLHLNINNSSAESIFLPSKYSNDKYANFIDNKILSSIYSFNLELDKNKNRTNFKNLILDSFRVLLRDNEDINNPIILEKIKNIKEKYPKINFELEYLQYINYSINYEFIKNNNIDKPILNLKLDNLVFKYDNLDNLFTFINNINEINRIYLSLNKNEKAKENFKDFLINYFEDIESKNIIKNIPIIINNLELFSKLNDEILENFNDNTDIDLIKKAFLKNKEIIKEQKIDIK